MIFPLCCLFVGVVLGRLLGFGEWLDVDLLISLSLYLVVFCAGIDVGCKREVLRRVGKYGLRVLVLPAAITLGSLAAAALLGTALGYPLGESTAVGMGLGYYSLSSGLLTSLGGGHIAPLAFLSNILREVLSLAFIPVISKVFGRYAAVAPAGAASMDTALGVISASTDEEITVLAMINGVVLTLLVPVLLPLLYQYL